MLTPDSKAAWERFGKNDPYFGVLSQPQYHGQTLSTERKKEFFLSGSEYIGDLLRFLNLHFGEIGYGNALDFGCGVGRLVIPLSESYKSTIGIDISTSMLAEAKINCSGQRQCSFFRFLSDIDPQVRFDLVHSFIVFQHIEPARAKLLFLELVSRLTPGGIGAVHFTYAHTNGFLHAASRWTRRHIPLMHYLLNVIKRRPAFQPLMQMNHHDIRGIIIELHRLGCSEIVLRLIDDEGCLGSLICFRKPSSTIEREKAHSLVGKWMSRKS